MINIVELIDDTQYGINTDVLINQIDYLYKEYQLLNYSDIDIYQEASEENDEKKNKKDSLGNKILTTIKNIWNQICKWVHKILNKFKSNKTKKDIKTITEMNENDMDKLDSKLEQAVKELEKKQSSKETVTQEFGDVGIANMRDIGKYIDIDQYERQIEENKKAGLKSQLVGHAATATGYLIAGLPIAPLIGTAATTIFAGYSVYLLIDFLHKIFKYWKLSINKHSIYGNIPPMKKMKEAISSMNNKMKQINLIIPGKPTRITELRASSVMNEIKIHDSSYHPVFRQCEYFYENDILRSKIMKSRSEGDASGNTNALNKKDVKIYCECMNFAKNFDLETVRLFDEFEKHAKEVNDAINNSTIKKITKNNALMNELMRTSKDSLKMVTMIHAFTRIASDTCSLLALCYRGNGHIPNGVEKNDNK